MQRGGWYDVVERVKSGDQETYRFAWHDRKAWWQQEQAILAYLILNGTVGGEANLREARQAQAFYNTFFLDHDEGAVYFNVLASGTPYLLGTERLKGSHSMSMYHSAELCYLSAVYNNLLVNGREMDFHFQPDPTNLPDRVLRVSPDLLPAGLGADRVRRDRREAVHGLRRRSPHRTAARCPGAGEGQGPAASSGQEVALNGGAPNRGECNDSQRQGTPEQDGHRARRHR